MNDSMIGKLIASRYQIIERLDIGGMAEVFKAQDIVLGRIVAIKVMLPQYAADPEFTQRFRQEAASAANLQNPYIVNIYDWGQDSGTYYIVMEYVRGSDLKECIRQRGAINQRKVAEIGMQVCQALSAATRSRARGEVGARRLQCLQDAGGGAAPGRGGQGAPLPRVRLPGVFRALLLT